MSTIYLHVGPHKTGTTYLQKLWENNTESLAKNRLLYPKIFYTANGQHHFVTHLLANNFDETFQQAVEFLNAAEEDIILSSENFSVLKKEQFATIRKVLAGKEIKVVYYYRHSTQRFLSKWQETIKQGERHSFYEYYTKHNLKPFQSNELNPLLLLDMLSQVFGKKNIHIVDYKQAYSQLSMMKEFEKIMHRENVIPDANETVNSMSNLADIEIIRVLNYKAFKSGILKQSNVREVYNMLIYKNILNTEKVKEKIFKYSTLLKLGNTQVDRQIHSNMEKQYGSNFVNNTTKVEEKEYLLINDRYLLDEQIMAELDQVFALVSQHVKA